MHNYMKILTQFWFCRKSNGICYGPKWTTAGIENVTSSRNIQSNWVVTSSKGPNKLCRYK